MTNSTAASPREATPATGEDESSESASLQQVLVVTLCLAFNMVDGFDITAMAVVASAVASDLGIGNQNLGLIFSFALAGIMCGSMLLAPISDQVGRRRAIVGSLAIVAVSVFLTAYAGSLSAFIVLRFLAGVGAGALLACVATLASEYSPSKYRTLAVTIVVSGYPIGAALTAVLAGVIMPDYGWRGMFVFGGGATFMLFFFAVWLIPESLAYLYERRPPNALERANRERAKLGREPLPALPSVRAEQRPSFVESMRRLLADEHRATTLLLWLTAFMVLCSLYFALSWTPKLIEQSGLPARDARRAFLCLNLGGVMGAYAVGLLGSRMALRTVVAGAFLLATIAMIVFANLPPRMTPIYVVIALFGFFQHGGWTGMYALAAEVYPTNIRGTGVGWAVGLGRIGAVVGPALAGWLIAGGIDMSTSYMVFAIPMAIATITAALIRPS